MVTVTSSGIGAETCRLLRDQGAKVIGVDLNETSRADQFFKAGILDPDSIAGLNGYAADWGQRRGEHCWRVTHL